MEVTESSSANHFVSGRVWRTNENGSTSAMSVRKVSKSASFLIRTGLNTGIIDWSVEEVEFISFRVQQYEVWKFILNCLFNLVKICVKWIFQSWAKACVSGWKCIYVLMFVWPLEIVPCQLSMYTWSMTVRNVFNARLLSHLGLWRKET